MNRCIVGDCREEMRKLEADSIDAIITDPPYHLTTGKKGGSGSASLNENSPAGRARIGTGFMGMKWDGGGVAFDPRTWIEALRVAKPGAHLLAFGGTRTFHRMWCAVEDAGWEIRDTLMWLHGEGFPKSSNQHGDWEGWGTALKPAFEPILMARKPLIGTVAENLQRFRTSALNIAECRIQTDDAVAVMLSTGGRKFEQSHSQPNRINKQIGTHNRGRWPANVMHDGSDEVVAMFPRAPGAQAPVTGREPSASTSNVYGRYRRAPSTRTDEPSADRRYTEHGGTNFAVLPGERRFDTGSSARFFWCPKASKRDRNDGLVGMPHENFHPTVKPTELMRYLCRLVTPPCGTILDILAGSCSTGKAAILEGFNVICIDESAEYIEIGRARMAWAEREYAGMTAQQGMVFA